MLKPGESATTAGTSGVLYDVSGEPVFDNESRVNTFVHVNDNLVSGERRYGVLACINGTGSLYRWLRDMFDSKYRIMDMAAGKVEPGANGLMIFPYGNGRERTLGGRNTGMTVSHADFNVHGRGHLARAAQEGIVLALRKGGEIMEKDMGIMPSDVIRAGNANMFKSDVFSQIYADVLGKTVVILDTDGSQGAARGAGIGIGLYGSPDDAFVGLKPLKEFKPDPGRKDAYDQLYARWSGELDSLLA